MNALVLGSRPEPLIVQLVAGDPFVAGLDLDVPWPATPVLELIHTGGVISWSSVASGQAADWSVDDAAVDAALAAGVTHARLTVAGTVWYAGRVERIDP